MAPRKPTDRTTLPRIPAATYRLQFNSRFRFADACRLINYLHDLGVSDVYASPLLKARSGSVHGYDVTDPNLINPEIGTRTEFEDFSQQLHRCGMGLLLDIVPNHMAASLENPWWTDILARGESSPYARFFDIDWSEHKVLLPILGKPYGESLESGDIAIRQHQGQLVLEVSGQKLPVATPRVAPGRSIDDLHELISAQPYRLAYWRKAADSINYRRFFDINDLIGVRAERDDVFEATHATILDMVNRGLVDGLRIDHIDGLLDPKTYLDRLPEIYVVVEKILGADESLPADWKTQGTTGYDFLNILNGAFVEVDGYRQLQRIYREVTGIKTRRLEIFHARKRQVMKELFAREVMTLTDRLVALAQSHREACDLTRWELQDSLISATAGLPVYRTYIRDFAISESDRAYIEAACVADSDAVSGAMKFLREVLLLEPPQYLADRRADYLDFVVRWQQFTGPVMAKGLEDTTFYVYNPLLSLNEVGGDCAGPENQLGVENFHCRNADRLERYPFTMNSTATHDTKRGEDVRARIDVLSEMPSEWEHHLKQWKQWNPCLIAPDENEQVLIYQTLLGAWPVSRDRLDTYLVKALREAKTHTNWLHPDTEYEKQVRAFVNRITNPERSGEFLKDFQRFQRRIAFFGALNSLAQTLLKITSPGVPDFYNGTELWDLSLADPDNRRAVDFDERMQMLEELKSRGNPSELLRQWQDGRIKMFLIWKALNFRRENLALFLHGDYIPLETTGRHAAKLTAFARRHRERCIVVAVPRLTSQLTRYGTPPLGETVWSDTSIVLPQQFPQKFADIFTGNTIESPSAATIFSDLPVSLLQAV